MILVTRAATNTIDLTLTESVTLTNPYYLFVFTNKQTQEVSKCLLTDSSSYPERYNRFSLIEGTSVTLIAGDYVLQVYEKSVSNTTIPADTYLLETVIARVVLVDAVTETEYTSDLSTAPLVYAST
jgi:hypothetical protein